MATYSNGAGPAGPWSMVRVCYGFRIRMNPLGHRCEGHSRPSQNILMFHLMFVPQWSEMLLRWCCYRPWTSWGENIRKWNILLSFLWNATSLHRIENMAVERKRPKHGIDTVQGSGRWVRGPSRVPPSAVGGVGSQACSQRSWILIS